MNNVFPIVLLGVLCSFSKSTVTPNQNVENGMKNHLGADECKKMVLNCKFKNHNAFVNVIQDGVIDLQDYGYDVWFGNNKDCIIK